MREETSETEKIPGGCPGESMPQPGEFRVINT